MLLAIVPNAAPTVPKLGIRITLKTTVSTVIVMPSRSGVRASPAARNAPLSMKNIIMPRMPDEHRAQERQRLGLHRRRRVDQVEQAGAAN